MHLVIAKSPFKIPLNLSLTSRVHIIFQQTTIDRAIKQFFAKRGLKVRGHKVAENNDVFELKEPIAPYNAHLHTENDRLNHENMYYWEGSIINSTS